MSDYFLALSASVITAIFTAVVGFVILKINNRQNAVSRLTSSMWYVCSYLDNLCEKAINIKDNSTYRKYALDNLSHLRMEMLQSQKEIISISDNSTRKIFWKLNLEISDIEWHIKNESFSYRSIDHFVRRCEHYYYLAQKRLDKRWAVCYLFLK